MLSNREKEPTTCCALLRAHLGDWILIVVLGFAGALITLITPFQQLFDPSDPRLRYPLKPSSVPDWMVPVISLAIPIVLFVAVYYWARTYSNSFQGPKARLQLHRYILGLCLSNAITFIITTSMKVAVGQPRPNFIALSGWESGSYTKGSYEMREAFSAFPSGHSSMSACGMVFLSMVMLGTFNRPSISMRPNQAWRTIVCLLPYAVLVWVMCSRIVDYWHDYGDVIAGALIGGGVALLCYHQHAGVNTSGQRRKSSTDHTVDMTPNTSTPPLEYEPITIRNGSISSGV